MTAVYLALKLLTLCMVKNMVDSTLYKVVQLLCGCPQLVLGTLPLSQGLVKTPGSFGAPLPDSQSMYATLGFSSTWPLGVLWKGTSRKSCPYLDVILQTDAVSLSGKSQGLEY
jgi:hypothetical protein